MLPRRLSRHFQLTRRPSGHTGGKGVERITAKGVVVEGREYPLDCLIFATGFEVGTSYARRAGYHIHGVGGGTPEEKWAAGAKSLHGLTGHDYPNCFIFSTIQSGFTANYPHALAEHSLQAAYIIAETPKARKTRVEPSAAAEEAWTEEILGAVLDRRAFMEECAPGYYDGEGQVSPLVASYASSGKGSVAFFKRLAAWREAGNIAGLELS